MSSSGYETYLGPYVSFANPIHDTKVYVEGCSECRRRHSNSYCPDCGVPHSTFERIEKAFSIDRFVVSEAIQERLFRPISNDGCDLWAPNVKYVGAPNYKSAGESETAVFASDIPEQIVRFREAFSDELKTMAAIYGCEPVVKWGRIIWYG